MLLVFNRGASSQTRWRCVYALDTQRTTLVTQPNIQPNTQAAQILGGVLGATLAILLIPQHLQRSFSGFGLGVRPGVLLWQGLLCELVLALVLNLIVLWSMNVNPYVAYWTLLSATLVLIVVGAELTGPSMNPAIVCGGMLWGNKSWRWVVGKRIVVTLCYGSHCLCVCICQVHMYVPSDLSP